jgi:hypothetical protein
METGWNSGKKRYPEFIVYLQLMERDIFSIEKKKYIRIDYHAIF